MAQANTLFSGSALQNNNAMGHYSCKGSNFKTSNPQIFPSLHPLSGFYNQKKVVQSNSNLTEKKELEVSCEPIKKQRLNMGNERPMINIEKTDSSLENSSKQLRGDQNKKKDDYVFRVPQLPRRLLNQNKTSTTKVEASVINAPVNLGTTVGFEMNESLNYKPADRNVNKKVKVMKSEKSVKAAKILQTANELEHQSIGLVDQGFDPAWLSSVYQKLVYEYYALQFEQTQQNFLAQMTNNNIIKGQNAIRDSLLIL